MLAVSPSCLLVLFSLVSLFFFFFFFLAHICVIYLFPAGVGYLSCPDVDGLLADAGLSMDQVMAMVAGMSMNAPLLPGSGSFQMPSGLGNMLGGMADMMGDMMGDMTDMLGGANLDLLQAGLQAARAAATAQGCSRRDRRMFSDMLGGLDDMMDGVDEMMGGLASGFGAMGMDITSMMEDNNAPDCGTLLAAVAASESAVQAAGGTIGDASGASAVTATMAGVVVVVAAMLF